MVGTAFLRYVGVVGEFGLDVGPPARRCAVAKMLSEMVKSCLHSSEKRSSTQF